MFKDPGETVFKGPGETVFKGPGETVAKGLGETVANGPWLKLQKRQCSNIDTIPNGTGLEASHILDPLLIIPKVF